MQTQEPVREHELGNLLRYWRHQRGKSQLDLSLDTGISQRHLSFVESGRSVPSRDLLLIVSEKLDIPLRERHDLRAGLASIHELRPEYRPPCRDTGQPPKLHIPGRPVSMPAPSPSRSDPNIPGSLQGLEKDLSPGV